MCSISNTWTSLRAPVRWSTHSPSFANTAGPFSSPPRPGGGRGVHKKSSRLDHGGIAALVEIPVLHLNQLRIGGVTAALQAVHAARRRVGRGGVFLAVAVQR